jgi:AcrR family transcriptional regulator
MTYTVSSAVPPKQLRSRQTLDRLLDAAEAVIREEGIAELTVVKVVRKAQSSVGAFYRRFPDRDALLYAIQERNHARAREVYDAQLATLMRRKVSLEETLGRLFSLRAKMVLKDAPLLHAFVVQEAILPLFQQEGRKFYAYCRTAMTQVLLSHRDEIAHPEPELAAEMVCRTWLGLMEQVVLYGASPFDTEARSGDTHTLVAEYTKAMSAYLRGGAADPVARPRADWTSMPSTAGVKAVVE